MVNMNLWLEICISLCCSITTLVVSLFCSKWVINLKRENKSSNGSSLYAPYLFILLLLSWTKGSFLCPAWEIFNYTFHCHIGTTFMASGMLRTILVFMILRFFWLMYIMSFALQFYPQFQVYKLLKQNWPTGHSFWLLVPYWLVCLLCSIVAPIRLHLCLLQ